MKKQIVELTQTQRTRFDKCWSVWVQKNGKGQAEITWAKYDFDDAMTETIFGGILEYNRQKNTKYMTKEQKRFIPHFSTWLNNKGWVFEQSKDGEYVKKSVGTSCECGQKATTKYQGKDVCTKCYDKQAHPDFNKEVYKNLCDNGLGKLKDESREDYLKRIKQTGLKALKQFQSRGKAA